ncbi:hypothetical protein D3C78_1026480 [compost metagenome]
MTRADIRRHQLVDTGADQLARRMTEQLVGLGVGDHDPPIAVDDEHAVRGELDDLPIPGLGLATLLALGIQLAQGVLVAAQGAAEVADFRLFLDLRIMQITSASQQLAGLAGQLDQRQQDAAMVEPAQHHHYQQQAHQHQHLGDDDGQVDLTVERLDPCLILLMDQFIQLLQRLAECRLGGLVLGAEQQVDGLLFGTGIGKRERPQLQGEQVIGAAKGLQHQRVVALLQPQGKELLDGPVPRTDMVPLGDELPLEALVAADHVAVRRQGQRLGAQLQLVESVAGAVLGTHGVAALDGQLGGQQNADAGQGKQPDHQEAYPVAEIAKLHEGRLPILGKWLAGSPVNIARLTFSARRAGS